MLANITWIRWGRRDDIEGSDTIQFRIVDIMVWLAEACLIIINPMINSLFDLYVGSLNMMWKLSLSHFVNMFGNKI